MRFAARATVVEVGREDLLSLPLPVEVAREDLLSLSLIALAQSPLLPLFAGEQWCLGCLEPWFFGCFIRDPSFSREAAR
jgi:hypothetical protein